VAPRTGDRSAELMKVSVPRTALAGRERQMALPVLAGKRIL